MTSEARKCDTAPSSAGQAVVTGQPVHPAAPAPAGASNKAEQVAGIAARLGEPEALVSRCWDPYGPEPAEQGRWQKSKAPWGNTLRDCPHGCRAVMLQPLIDEIHGGVLSECRLDLGGVEWGKTYALWLVEPEPGGQKAA